MPLSMARRAITCSSFWSVTDLFWFGGTPLENFVNCGLYRMNLTSGACERFGPSDGFRPAQQDRVYAGLWLGDRLWLTTTEGLCAVRERK